MVVEANPFLLSLKVFLFFFILYFISIQIFRKSRKFSISKRLFHQLEDTDLWRDSNIQGAAQGLSDTPYVGLGFFSLALKEIPSGILVNRTQT